MVVVVVDGRERMEVHNGPLGLTYRQTRVRGKIESLVLPVVLQLLIDYTILLKKEIISFKNRGLPSYFQVVPSHLLPS